MDARAIYDLRQVTNPLAVPGVVVRCHACGMESKALSPGFDVAEAYGDAYGEEDTIAGPYMLGDATRRLFRRALEGVDVPKRDGAPAPRLLDIGTGLGAMLEEATKLGFQAHGVELCAPLAAKARARGLDVRTERAEALAARTDEAGRYNVVTMMDVIEHVPDPVAVLKAVRSLLAPGGELVVYTPNHRGAVVLLARALHTVGIGGPVVEIFGGNHVCFFDDRTLPRALDRAGFETRVLRRAPYDPARPGQVVPLLSRIGVTAIERLGQPLGRVFRMTAYARVA